MYKYNQKSRPFDLQVDFESYYLTLLLSFAQWPLPRSTPTDVADFDTDRVNSPHFV